MTGVQGSEGRKACDAPPQRRMVAIIPGEAKFRHSGLVRALEEAFPVRLVASTGDDIGAAAAVIVFPEGRRPERLRVPCLVLRGHRMGQRRQSSFAVEMSRCADLDRALHGQALRERDRRSPAAVMAERDCRVLASVAGNPVWTHRALDGFDVVTASSLPSELAEGEFLRDHLTAGRFWSLLPIVHFLKRIFPPVPGSSEARRACFVIDDPNPRFGSYGYINFAELARDAREAPYHVAIATIPLDLLVPGRRAVQVFREHQAELSLVVHGNDHLHHELERCRDTAEADRMMRSALARVGRFEARAGIRVERVMCPPHGRCSHEALGALFRHGFLGLAASRPFPWAGFSQHRDWRLGGWLPAQLAAGGFPVIPRMPLTGDLDDLVFRAFLGLPLVVYCHHSDLSGGLEPFRTAAARVAALGDVRWSSLASLVHTNAVCHERDGVATVTIFSTDVRMRMPTAPAVRVEIPRIFGGGHPAEVMINGAIHRTDERGHVGLATKPTGGDLRIRILSPARAVPPSVRDWRPRAWPIVRRAMTETRDRAGPVVRNLRN